MNTGRKTTPSITIKETILNALKNKADEKTINSLIEELETSEANVIQKIKKYSVAFAEHKQEYIKLISGVFSELGPNSLDSKKMEEILKNIITKEKMDLTKEKAETLVGYLGSILEFKNFGDNLSKRLDEILRNDMITNEEIRIRLHNYLKRNFLHEDFSYLTDEILEQYAAQINTGEVYYKTAEPFSFMISEVLLLAAKNPKSLKIEDIQKNIYDIIYTYGSDMYDNHDTYNTFTKTTDIAMDHLSTEEKDLLENTFEQMFESIEGSQNTKEVDPDAEAKAALINDFQNYATQHVTKIANKLIDDENDMNRKIKNTPDQSKALDLLKQKSVNKIHEKENIIKSITELLDQWKSKRTAALIEKCDFQPVIDELRQQVDTTKFKITSERTLKLFKAHMAFTKQIDEFQKNRGLNK